MPKSTDSLAEYSDARRVIVLAGEGRFSGCSSLDHARRDREAQALIAFAERFDAPCWPIRSQLRSTGHPAVIAGMTGSWDPRICRPSTWWCALALPCFQTHVPDDRDPRAHPDRGRRSRDTRLHPQTTTFVKCDPTEFVTALLEAGLSTPGEHRADASSPLISPCAQEWGMLDASAPSASPLPTSHAPTASKAPTCAS